MKPKIEVKWHSYHCHPETCNHRNHDGWWVYKDGEVVETFAEKQNAEAYAKELSIVKVRMYQIRTWHADSWSGGEAGEKLYFRNREEANEYMKAYHAKYNPPRQTTPECYTTFDECKEVWVEEHRLELRETDLTELGLYCIKKGKN